MDPRYSRLDAQVVRESAKNRLFLEANKSILIQGDCVLCGFQNSKEIIIKGKCKKSNFDQISKSIQIDGNVSKCVFNSVGRIRIYGTAKNCSFIGSQGSCKTRATVGTDARVGTDFTAGGTDTLVDAAGYSTGTTRRHCRESRRRN